MRTLTKTLLILSFFLIFPRLGFAHLPPTGIKEEGGTEYKPVFTMNCIGDRLTCTHSGSTGTVTMSGTLDTDDVFMPEVGSATYDNLEDFMNNTVSSGFVSGGAITDNSNGTVAVAAGTGYIRADASEISELKAFDWAAVDPLDLTDDALNYIYIDYSGGSPVVTFTTDLSTLDHTSEFVIGLAYQEATHAHIATSGQRLNNFIHDLYFYSWEYDGIQRASGMVTSEDASEDLAVNVTAGVNYWALERHTASAFDSSTDGANQTFEISTKNFFQ